MAPIRSVSIGKMTRLHLIAFQVEVDITLDENSALFDLYRFEIPVFFLESRFVSKNRIDVDRLLQVLDEAAPSDQLPWNPELCR